MLKELRKRMEELHMLSVGDRVLVGVSGGADSVCLLLVLLALKEELDLCVEAIHVEHGILKSSTLLYRIHSLKLHDSNVAVRSAGNNLNRLCALVITIKSLEFFHKFRTITPGIKAHLTPYAVSTYYLTYFKKIFNHKNQTLKIKMKLNRATRVTLKMN
jgi:3'-phosphoadenosine 5'-phosphosulfate sulfotransferase (PAPS reductase)/FAD synthetase